MPAAGTVRGQAKARRGERFAALTAAIARRLPFGLDRVVAPNMVGFVLINCGTFATDLVLLTVLHGALRWPVPVSITASYLTAAGLSYLLNRTLNFRSHGAVGPQMGMYAAVVVVNYLAWILGVGAGLAALRLDYRLARILAAVCEAGYMYAAMRWVVFRDEAARDPGAARAPPSSGPSTNPDTAHRCP